MAIHNFTIKNSINTHKIVKLPIIQYDKICIIASKKVHFTSGKNPCIIGKTGRTRLKYRRNGTVRGRNGLCPFPL